MTQVISERFKCYLCWGFTLVRAWSKWLEAQAEKTCNCFWNSFSSVEVPTEQFMWLSIFTYTTHLRLQKRKGYNARFLFHLNPWKFSAQNFLSSRCKTVTWQLPILSPLGLPSIISNEFLKTGLSNHLPNTCLMESKHNCFKETGHSISKKQISGFLGKAVIFILICSHFRRHNHKNSCACSDQGFIQPTVQVLLTTDDSLRCIWFYVSIHHTS